MKENYSKLKRKRKISGKTKFGKKVLLFLNHKEIFKTIIILLKKSPKIKILMNLLRKKEVSDFIPEELFPEYYKFEDRLPQLTLKDISIINSFPINECEPLVLDVGCGPGRIDYHLLDLNYNIYATDYRKHKTWKNKQNGKNFLKFYISDIYKLRSFPIKSAPIVICSEVIEHLVNYRKALRNLLTLTQNRLIITIPFEESFGGRFAPPPIGHAHYWSDKRKLFRYKDVKEFLTFFYPYSVSISKIRTKQEDIKTEKYAYLIIVDKTQKLS